MEQNQEYNFDVQPITPDMVDEATEMRLQSWVDTYVNDDLGITKEWIEARNREQMSDERRQARLERLNQPNSAYYVARDNNGKIIGVTNPYVDEEGAQHVGSLYVDKDWHGKGVSHALMQKVIDWSDKNKPLELGVVIYNKRARNFYRKWGFEEVPNSETLFDDKIPVIKMIRPPQERFSVSEYKNTQ